MENPTQCRYTEYISTLQQICNCKVRYNYAKRVLAWVLEKCIIYQLQGVTWCHGSDVNKRESYVRINVCNYCCENDNDV